MYAICVESSHERGMGHLFCGINLYRFLEERKEAALVLVNNNEQAIRLLMTEEIPFEVVNFDDVVSDWESRLIKKYGIDVWLNNKFWTGQELYRHVKQNRQVILAAIDESGDSAELLDIHFVATMLDKNYIPKGKKIFVGMDYIILNEEIKRYQWLRTKAERVIVSMGGSDTYGVTVRILDILKKKNIYADIVLGPSFAHMDELAARMESGYHVYRNVPSLIELFAQYDLAITGGGITCLEAAAMGLPCIIVANEVFEIDMAECVEKMGAAVFAGYYTEIDEKCFDFVELDIKKMSTNGMNHVTLDGAENIYEKICEYKGSM